MSDVAVRVYVVMGAAGSGRREILRDVIASGLTADEVAGVLTTEDEATTWPDGVVAGTWDWDDDGQIAAEIPGGANVVFFLADGRGNPVDQVEALKPWLARVGAELARVVSVVHCTLLAAQPAVMAWYDACIHFSDLVLLNRREGVPNKWMSEYRTRFAKNYLPCLVEMVKKGRVANPALVLDEQVRRLSHWFDAAEDDGGWATFVAAADDDVVIEDEAEQEVQEELDAEPEDEYLQLNLGGTRRKVIPDIRDYLDA